MLADLVPEVVGLAVTPAAVAGCILLLESKRPLANAASFASAFLLVYGVVSVAALLGGGAAGASDSDDTVRDTASAMVGGLFLLLAVVAWRRRPARRAGPPKWVRALESSTPRRALSIGVVLAVLNPNLAILLSGLSIVVTADAGSGERIGGVLLLLAGSLVDFAVPIAAFIVLGDRAAAVLQAARRWLVAHDRQLSIGVLVVFGLAFLVRGTAGLAG